MKKSGSNPALPDVLHRKGGILLDLGCGFEKQGPEFVGLDKREIPGVVDIVHDMEVLPWPLPDESCLTVLGSHIVEHLKPWLFMDIMNEIWRITKMGGQAAFAHPYAGSHGYFQDPTHCHALNEASWLYFDPRHLLYDIYAPMPWEIQKGYPVWQTIGNVEVLMVKISPEEAAKRVKDRKDKKAAEDALFPNMTVRDMVNIKDNTPSKPRGIILRGN